MRPQITLETQYSTRKNTGYGALISSTAVPDQLDTAPSRESFRPPPAPFVCNARPIEISRATSCGSLCPKTHHCLCDMSKSITSCAVKEGVDRIISHICTILHILLGFFYLKDADVCSHMLKHPQLL